MKKGEDAIFFGVTQRYMQSIIDAWGESSMKAWVSEGMPRLEDLYKTELAKAHGDQALTQRAETRYRKVLGILAWAALSRADLAYASSFLARCQSKPNSAAEACMRSLIRWLKHGDHLHRVQRFPAETPPRISSSDELLCWCDASWNVPSVSGGVVSYRGCTLKYFSRKQECPALSSTEAELMALVESCKEMLSLGMLLYSLEVGLKFDQEGFVLTTTHPYKMSCVTDNQAAESISKMHGLLRRVKHVELRFQFLQRLVHQGRVKVTWEQGIDNPADALTKARTFAMLQHLEAAVGLTLGPSDDVVSLVSTTASFSREGDDGDSDAEWDTALSASLNFAGVCSVKDRSVVTSAFCDQVSFGEMLIDFRSLEVLVVEVCAGGDSAISQVCRKAGIPCVSLTKEGADVLSSGVQDWLMSLMRFVDMFDSLKVYVHISTPCTTGCRYRFLNRRKASFRQKWYRKVAEHKMMWQFLGRLLKRARRSIELSKVCVTQEWPRNNDLWSEEVYCKNNSGLDHLCFLDRCCFTRKKEWKQYRVASTFPMPSQECTHGGVKKGNHTRIDVYESGFYPLRMAAYLLDQGRKALSDEVGLWWEVEW